MTIEERRRATTKRLNDPNTADNMEVRKTLMKRVHAGEMTLEAAQTELKRIKARAKRDGQQTAYGG